jgi:hypothetical protein
MKTEISKCHHLVWLFTESMLQFRKIGLLLFFATLFITASSQTRELNIGTATVDITPALPISLAGQFQVRIAKIVEAPLKANVIALESRYGNRSLDEAIMVSCDIIGIPNDLLKKVRDEVHRQMPELDVTKIFLNAIHTHTAPELNVEAFVKLFVQRVSEAIVKAWTNRLPGSVSWGLGHAVIANNRRVVYADGTAQMYGKTNVPEFSNMEGIEDHGVNTLFFWDKSGKLIAMAIDVPCPAQENEGGTEINSDYWYPVREKLKQHFGPDLCVLGWIGAAGDQSPHLMYREAAEDRMMNLRKLSRLEEISRRIVLAVEETYETVKEDRYTNVVLIHTVETLSLPRRTVTEAEYISSKAKCDEGAAQIAADSTVAGQVLGRISWNRKVVDRFEKQKTEPNPKTDTEIHVLRLGDVAICTNQFELFTDYGIQIQTRSKALQTFVIQLAGPGTYLPTEKAVKAGGYSAVIQSNLVGPEGGKILVDSTLKLINDMFIVEKQ